MSELDKLHRYSESDRIEIVHEMYVTGAWQAEDSDVWREALLLCWGGQTGYIHMKNKMGPDNIIKMFSDASFPIPEITNPVSVFRGGRGETPFDLGMGLSWTLDKECASFFASVYESASTLGLSGQPLIVEWCVNPDDIIFYSDDRSEKEVFLRYTPAESDLLVHDDIDQLKAWGHSYKARTK